MKSTLRHHQEDLEKEDLIRQYLPMVKVAVRSAAKEAGCPVDPVELFENGILGLVHALQHYRYQDDCPFMEYALRHIRSHLARTLGHRSNPHWRRLRKVRRALEMKLGRAPHDWEIAQRMKMPVASVRCAMERMAEVELLSLGQLEEPEVEPGDGEYVMQPSGKAGDVMTFDRDPLTELLNDENARLIEIALNRLPHAEKDVLMKTFYENLEPAAIAGRMGITEHEVSLLRSAGLRRLRKHLMMHH